MRSRPASLRRVQAIAGVFEVSALPAASIRAPQSLADGSKDRSTLLDRRELTNPLGMDRLWNAVCVAAFPEPRVAEVARLRGTWISLQIPNSGEFGYF